MILNAQMQTVRMR